MSVLSRVTFHSFINSKNEQRRGVSFLPNREAPSYNSSEQGEDRHQHPIVVGLVSLFLFGPLRYPPFSFLLEETALDSFLALVDLL